jgi:hypothetical protein
VPRVFIVLIRDEYSWYYHTYLCGDFYMECNAINNFKYITSLPPEELFIWVKKHTTSHENHTDSFNWLGLGQLAIQHVYDAQEEDLVWIWSDIALQVYTFLDKYQGKPYSDSFIKSLMTFRTYLITRYGAVIGDELRDPHIIRQWFLDSLPLTFSSFQELVLLTYSWQSDVYIKDTKYRRKILDNLTIIQSIRSRLGILMIIVNNGYFFEDRELAPWISYYSELR